MTRSIAALLLVVVLLVVLPLLGGDNPPDQLGSGRRTAEVLVPHTASPSPNDHALTGLAFELVKYQPRPRRKPVRHVLSAAGALYGHACGGDLPTCHVLACESGGDLTARNPHSSASGKWQILDGTWAGFGGFARAYLAPEAVQDAKARLLWAHGAGAHHWRSCL